jgi:glucosamine--fructose-6-phosphate aminotransferase (isomerizing)
VYLRVGPEIGVTSTKAFTGQVAVLTMISLFMARRRMMSPEASARLMTELDRVPDLIEQILQTNDLIRKVTEKYVHRDNWLFLGRGYNYPTTMEGALKLKEISYIHAEAYPAGELKHGPLALIDEQMPVVAVAPNNALLEKLKSNLEEVRARGGQLYVFADLHVSMVEEEGVTVIRLPETDDLIDPIIFTIPLQLLAYHVAVLKGTDVDQPRNLAKSVTVE